MSVKFVADPIILPDNYSYQDLEDAKLSAKWHRARTTEDRVKEADLDGKCGSCEHFIPCEGKYKCHGDCKLGRVGFRPRSTKGCTLYTKRKDFK